jgi:hypothetical protein
LITVTKQAKQVLKALLIASEPDQDEGLRLMPTDEGLVLALDTKLFGDLVIEYEGHQILLIGMEYIRVFDGKTIDCHLTENGTALTME